MPRARQSARSRAASSSDSGSVRRTTLYGLRAASASRSAGEITSYGGATRSASGPAAGPYRSAVKGRTLATAGTLPRLRRVAAIAELVEDRVVEGVYAVARKRRLRTRGGAPYP